MWDKTEVFKLVSAYYYTLFELVVLLEETKV